MASMNLSMIMTPTGRAKLKSGRECSVCMWCVRMIACDAR